MTQQTVADHQKSPQIPPSATTPNAREQAQRADKRIKWHVYKYGRIIKSITGLSAFTIRSAESQIAIWTDLFPNNRYFIE